MIGNTNLLVAYHPTSPTLVYHEGYRASASVAVVSSSVIAQLAAAAAAAAAAGAAAGNSTASNSTSAASANTTSNSTSSSTSNVLTYAFAPGFTLSWYLNDGGDTIHMASPF